MLRQFLHRMKKNKKNYVEDDVSKAVAEVNNGISIR